MNFYICSTPFLLCLCILLCNASIFNWFNKGNAKPYKEDETNEELTELVTLSPSELMKIRNSTALEYWRRDYDPFDKKHKYNETNRNKNGTTRKMEIQRQKSQSTKPIKRRSGDPLSPEARTSPIMRAEYGMQMTRKRNGNLRPNFRQVTSDYRSTRITPMSAEKLQQAIDEEAGMNEMMSAFNIADEVHKIVDDIPNINMTMEIIGRTIEYKDIILVKITESKEAIKKRIRFRANDDNKFIDEQPEKKIVYIVHGLSVMGSQYLPCFRRRSHFKKLLSFYFKHLDKFDIYLVPMANPDGQAFAMNKVDLKWNKNVSPQAACRGVALDRNFDVAWNTTKNISSCSQQYPGDAPFSEPETRAIRDIFHRYGHKIIAYINVHSGTYDSDTYKGDAVLYPKGYSDSTSDDDKYIDLRGEIDETMKNGNFHMITVCVDTLHSWYGRVFGTSVDYASTVYGVPFALEFVMQLYRSTVPNSNESEEKVNDAALDEIWGRVINIVFENIWKSLHQVNESK